MKRLLSALLVVSSCIVASAAQAQVSTDGPVSPPHPASHGKPTELSMKRAGSTSIDLRNLPPGKVTKHERIEPEPPEIEPIELPGSIPPPRVPITAPSAPAPSPSASFLGLDFANWGAGHPPDTNGDVGPTYFIETVNTSIGIYDKSTGTRVAAFTFNSLMHEGEFGNLCDTSNDGDPVVLYDSFEDRWVISDFAFQTDAGGVIDPPGVFQCFAVSKSGDPVSGGWNFYSINTTGGLGDYPKLGVWPDGIYMSVNLFNDALNAFFNPRLYALNKAQMYAGAPSVQVVTFDAPSAEFTILPANARLQTGTPPAGSPNYFAVVAQFLNAVSVYKFHVDWNSISTSTLTGPFISLTSTSWSTFIGTGTTLQPNTDVPSPANDLDTLYPRLMVQNQYTNIGGVESLWDSHTVGASGTNSTQAAVRYYQVKVTGGTVESNATQAFTWSPDATVHRFMPSVAVDRAGNMALGYSASSASLNPAIRYAGRLAGDAANTISQTETSLIEGTGSQSGTCGPGTCVRWGDYSSMSLDPDGCTFWMSNEYYAANGLNWQTRIGAFKYPSCTTIASGTVQGTVTATTGGAPISGATVSLGSRTTTTNGSGVYSFSGIPAGTYPLLTAAAAGFTTGTTSSIIVTSGGTTTKDFSLATAPTSACLADTSQADFQLGVPTNVDLTSNPGNVVLKENISPDQHADDNGFRAGYNFSTTVLIGQTFTPSVSATLARVDAFIFCNSCSGTNPNMTLEARTTSGGLPVMSAGGLLASSTIAGTSSGSGGTFTFTFSSPPTLAAGTQYGLVIRLVSNRTTGNQDWLATSGDVYAGGRRVNCTTSACSNPTGSNSNSDLVFQTYMDTGFAGSGDLISSLKDANPANGNTPIWSTLSWTATTPANTTLRFQAAGSDSAFGPFNFVGPDGSAATFYTTSGGSLGQFSGKRYVQYRAFLSDTNVAVTPTLNDTTVCYSSSSAPLANLSIANSDGVTTATPGGTVTYTITAANAGPSAAPGSSLTDTFPAALTCTWTCAGSAGGTCTASGSGDINDTVGLPVGGSVIYTASCAISPSATGSLANTASITAPAGVTDPNTGNNSAIDTDTLSPQANLAITNSDGAATATPGGTVTYTITASNSTGPSAAPGSNVSDTFPASLTCTWTCVGANGGTCTASGSGNINDTVSLPKTGSVTYTASCNISATATGTLVNVATVAPSATVSDPTPGNNTGTDTDTLSPQADLGITNTDGVTSATPGGAVTYTIIATNSSGPSAAPGSNVSDTFPASLTCTWTCVGANGGTCTASGSGNINDAVNLPKTGSVTYTASCNISAAATGSLVNTATVATSATVSDPTPGNNTATDTDTLVPQADLSIANSDGVTTATPGGSVTYTITAANAGPSPAPGSSVTDTFPAALTCTWTCVGSGSGTCTASGAGNITDTVGLPVGGSVTYTASCTISPSATGSLGNTAMVAVPGGMTDPTSANNSKTDTDTLSVQADLVLTISDSHSFAQVGDILDYVIEVTNPTGPSTAVATVSDALPAELGAGAWTCTPSASAACSNGSGNTLNDTATLPVGGKADYMFSAQVQSAGAADQIVNSASATLTSGSDPVLANNMASDTDTVVIFRNGFDDGQAIVANVNAAGASFITAQLRVDPGLLGSLGIVPVAVANGRSADGKRLFTLQVARFGAEIALRTLTTDSRGAIARSEWRTADLDRHVLEFAWQSASEQHNDGYFAAAAGGTPVLVDGRVESARLTYLLIPVENGVPWLLLIEH
jgi:uncharacterized repeat protein (TIGR01451 family)